MSRRQGLSLVSLTVVAAVVSITMVGITQMLSNMGRFTRQVSGLVENNNLFSSLPPYLMTSVVCNCNLTPAGASTRTFPAASAATTSFNLGSFDLYATGCTKGASLVATSASASPGRPWVSGVHLTNFFQITPSLYSASVAIDVKRSSANSQDLTQNFPVLLNTTTAAGTVTLNSCAIGTNPAAGTVLQMVTNSTTTDYTLGATVARASPDVSITPRSSNSTLLVSCTGTGNVSISGSCPGYNSGGISRIRETTGTPTDVSEILTQFAHHPACGIGSGSAIAIAVSLPNSALTVRRFALFAHYNSVGGGSFVVSQSSCTVTEIAN